MRRSACFQWGISLTALSSRPVPNKICTVGTLLITQVSRYNWGHQDQEFTNIYELNGGKTS